MQPTIDLYHTLWIERLSGIAEGDLANRVEVEISPWSEDMVAFGSMLARTFAAPLAEMPYRLPAWAQALQLVFDLAVIGLVVVLGRGRFWNWSGSQPERPYAILVAGALLLAALPAILPVAQPHYWAQAAPLLTILIAEHWRRRRRARRLCRIADAGPRWPTWPISPPALPSGHRCATMGRRR